MNTSTRILPLENLLQQSIRTYHSCTASNACSSPKIPLIQKLLHERKLKKLLESAMKDLPAMDESSWRNLSQDEKENLKRKLIETATVLDEESLLYSSPFLKEFMSIGFLEATEEFFSRAQLYEPGFKAVDLFQAVRNVWIMNCLQLLFHIPVKLTSSVFSYSLLYPYTDNFLDDPTISKIEKHSFNRMVYEKIMGNPASSLSSYEKKVYTLLQNIEEEFPRDLYPMVYEALWYIQDAQVSSMSQSKKDVSPEEILKLSFYKGGASVLADACLVKDNLTKDEILFAFGYGTFLQLLDDLQDRIEDASMNHQTLYSRIPLNVYLDEYIERLFRYIDCVLTSFQTKDEEAVSMKEVIRSCMRMMVESVVGKNPSFVSRNYYKTLEVHSSVRLSFYPAMEKLIEETLQKNTNQIMGS